jgi:hypothetical protein
MCPQECALIADVVAAARSTAASLVAAEDAAAAAALRSAADLLSAQAAEELAAGSALLSSFVKEKEKDSPQQALLLPAPLLAELLLRDAFVQAAAALYETYVRVREGAQFTCFTGTKVQMLTQRREQEAALRAHELFVCCRMRTYADVF